MTTEQERIQRLEDSLRMAQERLQRLEGGTRIPINTVTTDNNIDEITRLEESLKTVEERLQSLEEGIQPRLDSVEEDLSKIAPRIHSLTGAILDRFDKVSYSVYRMSESAKNGWKQSPSLGVKTQIYVFGPEGETISLETGSDDPIRNIIDMLEEKEKEKIPAYKTSLLFEGIRLDDERTLADYNIENGSTMDVCFRERGSG